MGVCAASTAKDIGSSSRTVSYTVLGRSSASAAMACQRLRMTGSEHLGFRFIPRSFELWGAAGASHGEFCANRASDANPIIDVRPKPEAPPPPTATDLLRVARLSLFFRHRRLPEILLYACQFASASRARPCHLKNFVNPGTKLANGAPIRWHITCCAD